MDIDNSDLDAVLNRFRTMNTNDRDHLINEFKRLSNTQLSTEGCCFYLDMAEWNLNTALWAYYEYENASGANGANLMLQQQQQQASSNTDTTNNSNQMVDIYQGYGQHYHHELPEMQFVCDVTIGEGESVHPGTNFIKTWRIKNVGLRRWPRDCKLKYVNGYNFTQTASAASPHYHSSSTSSSSSLTSNSDASSLVNATNANGELILVGPNDSPVSIDVKELEPHEECDLSISLKAPRQCGIYQCQYRMFTGLNQPFGDPIWLLLNVEEGGVLGITQQLNSVSMFGNWNQNPGSNGNNASENIFSKSPFKLDGLSARSDANNNNTTASTTTTIGNQESRPDFYDDMFS